MLLEQRYKGIILKVTQDQRQELADFYRCIEQRAFRMVMIETRHSGDALDLVQDAMESLMKSCASKPGEEWRPLFYRILQNKVKDWHRWGSVRAKIMECPNGSVKTHLSRALQSLQDQLEDVS